VSHVDEAVALLTGREAGERGDLGTFPEGMVYHAVETSLRELARKSRAFSKPGGESPAEI
jgi:hypothetical protein